MHRKTNTITGAVARNDGVRQDRFTYATRHGTQDVGEDDGGDCGRNLLRDLQRLTPPELLDPVLRVNIDGISQRELAREAGIDPGTMSRALKRRREEVKPYFLAVIAARRIEQGADDFTLDPRCGRPVEANCWAVPDGPEVRYDHAPRADELLTFLVAHRAAVFRAGAFFGGWASRPGGAAWSVALTRLAPTEAEAREAAQLRGAASIIHVPTGRPHSTSQQAA